MNIACVVDRVSRNAGGLFESVRRLAQSLLKTGSDIKAFGIEDELTASDVGKWKPVSVQTFPATFNREWGYAKELVPELVNGEFDVLLTHGLWKYSSVASLRWHRKAGRPYIIHPHGMLEAWALRNSRWKKRIAATLYEDRHLHGAACLRALGDAEARSMRDYGLRNPICVIPNGIDLPDLNTQRQAPWREIAAGRNVLLYLGRLHPKKNLLSLLDAWAVVSREPGARRWMLAIAGWDEGGYQAKLRQKTAQLGIDNDVLFLDPLFGEDKAAAYQNADAFILPSFSEGLPMVVLEAWAFAKPVLMTAECNLPQGFDSNAALKIGPTADDIASGLRSLIEMNDADRVAMGERGRALVSQKFSWAPIGREMCRVCEWVIGGGDTPASVRFD